MAGIEDMEDIPSVPLSHALQLLSNQYGAMMVSIVAITVLCGDGTVAILSPNFGNADQVVAFAKGVIEDLESEAGAHRVERIPFLKN